MSTTERYALPSGIEIRNDLRPGDIGYLTYLHGTLYAEEYGLNYVFEAYVAATLADFVKGHTDRERIWIVEKDGHIRGSIAIVKSSEEMAQLRWFLLHPDLRGHGIGKLLIEEAVNFCKQSGYSRVFLLTVSELLAAAALYKSAGFQLTEEETHPIWGVVITEQRYDLEL
jgi:N-acetylglutamate synthase-like GNAT family acetyltransferase